MTFSAKEAVLARLDKVRGPDRNGEYVALCPFHGDTNPSLNVNFGKGVYKCFGCESAGSVSSLAMALGIAASTSVKPEREVEARYDYPDAGGKLLYQVEKHNPKSFSQRRPDGAGGWIYDLKGVQRVLYRLPGVLEAVRKSETVYVVEGEKDADNLGKLGLTATTNPMGAGKWRTEYSETLTGANVLILPDKDEPGRKHASAVAHSLAGKAASIKIVELTGEGVKDVSDWIQAGGTRDELEHLASEAKPWQTTPASGFNLISLRDLLEEPPEDIAWVLENTLPRGGLSLLVAKPKVGKSTTARGLALTIASGGAEFLGRAITSSGPVVYLAMEEKRGEVRKHFERMGATKELPILIHVGSAPEEAMEELRKAIIHSHAVFAIVDPLQRLVRIHDLNDYAQVSLALEPLMQVARDTSCHIMLIHHANKSILREGGDSILGSTAIFGSVDCALIMKRTDAHRTIESIQRYGEDLPRTVLSFDPTTGLITSGGTLEDIQLAECAKEILALVTDHEMTARELKDGLTEHKHGQVSKSLQLLYKDGKVQRNGSGKKGDAYRYQAVRDSGDSGGKDKDSPTTPSILPERVAGPIPSRNCGGTDSGESHEDRDLDIPSIPVTDVLELEY